MLRSQRIPFDNSGYFFIGLLILVLFGFSGYLTTIVSTPDKFDGFFHFHAICMFLWIVMLVIQPFLIRTGRFEWHRRLGKVSYVLVPAFLLSVLLVLYSKVQKGGMEGEAMGIFFIVALDFLIFLITYSLAIYYRRRPAYHARFMVGTTVAMIEPALTRAIFILFAPIANPFLGLLSSLLLIDLLIVALVIADRKKMETRWIFRSILAGTVLLQALIIGSALLLMAG